MDDDEASVAEPPDEATPPPSARPPSAPPHSPPPSAVPQSIWAPPDAARTHDRESVGGGAEEPGSSAGVRIEVGHDGPPPPPFVRARRRRRRNLLLGLVAVVVVGTPIGLAVGGGLTGDDAPSADEGDVTGAPDGGGSGDSGDSGGGGDDLTLDAPDPATLDGLDAIYGRLLLDIDASEGAMLDFQRDLAEAFRGGQAGPEELLANVSDAAGDGRSALLTVRERLEEPLPDDGADEVRESYLSHLDSWVDYMAAVEEDPGILGSEDGASGFNVVINATADSFARTLERQLPEDIDEDVERFANGILDRGFRGIGDAQVSWDGLSGGTTVVS